MRTTAKADYAVRAAIELAAAADTITAEQIAQATGIPHNFLENILGELRRADLVRSHRGQAGGYLLAKACGPDLDDRRDPRRRRPPRKCDYEGSTAKLRDVYVALRASVRSVLDDADAWVRR